MGDGEHGPVSQAGLNHLGASSVYRIRIHITGDLQDPDPHEGCGLNPEGKKIRNKTGTVPEGF